MMWIPLSGMNPPHFRARLKPSAYAIVISVIRSVKDVSLCILSLLFNLRMSIELESC